MQIFTCDSNCPTVPFHYDRTRSASKTSRVPETTEGFRPLLHCSLQTLCLHPRAIHNNGFYFRNQLRDALILQVNAYCVTAKRMPPSNGVFKRSFFAPLQKRIMQLEQRRDCTANTNADPTRLLFQILNAVQRKQRQFKLETVVTLIYESRSYYIQSPVPNEFQHQGLMVIIYCPILLQERTSGRMTSESRHPRIKGP